MKTYIFSLIVLMILAIIRVSYAQDFQDFAKLRRLYIETEKRVHNNRSYYLNEPRSATYDLNLGVDFDFPLSTYFRNKVVSTTDHSQFRFIGYHFEVGGEPIDNIEVYLRHFSGHAMDDQFPNRFPEDNTIGIRWIFFDKKQRR